MTVKEYLHQAYRLDQRIKSDTMEAQNLREMAGSVSAIQYDKDRVQASRNTEAPLSGHLRSCGHWKRKSPVSWKCYQTLRNRYERSLRQFLIPTSAWYSSTGTSTTIRGSRSEWSSVQMPVPFAAGMARHSFM